MSEKTVWLVTAVEDWIDEFVPFTTERDGHMLNVAKVVATSQGIRKYLLSRIEEERDRHEQCDLEKWISGPEKVDEIKACETGYYAKVKYRDRFATYWATRLDSVVQTEYEESEAV